LSFLINAPILGLTGGIATGKSTFAQFFSKRLPCNFFDSDAAVHQLLNGDPEVRHLICENVHPQAYRFDGSPDRKLLRSVIFSDPDLKRALEKILHPRVRERWQRLASESRLTGRICLVDIPLLYEVGATAAFDAVIVVACSGAVQLQRLCSRPGVSEEMAKIMIASQGPLEDKISKSDHVVWNDGSLEALETQSDLLALSFHVPNG
jgi:dephospho-CoA kinase